MKKPLPKIARCACGRKGRMDSAGGHCVYCARVLGCWWGPTRETERGAILAWNKVMGRKR